MISIVFFGEYPDGGAASLRVRAIAECLFRPHFDQVKIIASKKKGHNCARTKFMEARSEKFIIYYLSFIVFNIKLFFKNTPHTIILYNQDPILYILFYILSKIKKCLFVSQISEKRCLNDFEFTKESILVYLKEKLFFLCLHVIPTKMIVISKYLQEQYKENNFYLPSIYPSVACKKIIKKNQILYLGRGDKRDDLEKTIKFFEQIQKSCLPKLQNLNFIFAGLSMLNKKKVLSLVKRHNLKKIKVYGFLSKAQIHALQLQSKILILLRKNTISASASYPTRLVEAINCGMLCFTSYHSSIDSNNILKKAVFFYDDLNLSKNIAKLQKMLWLPINNLYFSSIKFEISPKKYSENLRQFLGYK